MNLTSERGRIQPPNLDDRTWQDLVDEMKALIPTYAKQWTDHNPSDLGITLIELFAWLVEQLIYRLNRVPEKNYIAFLNLLGIPRDPPAPARTFLTFSAQNGAVKVLVPKGTRAQTLGSEREAQVVFETDADLDVLPIDLKEVFALDGAQLTSIGEAFALPPSKGYTLTVAKGKTVQLCLGFEVPKLDTLKDQSLKVRMMFSKPLANDSSPTITWCYSTAAKSKPLEWLAVPGFPLPAGLSMEQKLQRDGVVELTLPVADAGATKAWAEQDAKTWVASPAGKEPSRYWVGIRIASPSSAADLNLGIHFILFNSVSAYNALTVTDEKLGAGTDENYQVFPLSHRPLFKRPDSTNPYDHLEVKVDGAVWEQQPDLLVDLDPNNPARACVVDPVTGEIRFGGADRDPETGKIIRSRGAKPPQGSVITASYRYVAGGAAGNVGAGKVVSPPSQTIKGVAAATNPVAGAGGRDEEPIEETLRRAPGLLKTRDRAITAEDYEYLAREGNPEVRIVRCLEPIGNDAPSVPGLDRSPGMVNLIIVSDLGLEEPRPQPTLELIQRVQGYLDQRRDLTAHLKVIGPLYLPVKVTTDVVIWEKAKKNGVKPDDVVKSTNEKIRRFLHPTRGGPDGGGWEVGDHVFVSDLFKAIMPPADVGYIQSVTIAEVEIKADGTENEVPSNSGGTVIAKDYQLVCSAVTHIVTPKDEPKGLQ